MTRYVVRQEINEASRESAEKHKEPWEVHEVQLLEESWETASLEEIAETLGRTVEACRQKHYDLKDRMIAQQRKSTETIRWAKGFTSLEEMGY